MARALAGLLPSRQRRRASVENAVRNLPPVQKPVKLLSGQVRKGCPYTIAIGFEQAFCQGTKSEGGGAGERLGCGVLGGTALGLGAAAAAPYSGYGDPCLRQQQVIDAWGNAQWTNARVC